MHSQHDSVAPFWNMTIFSLARLLCLLSILTQLHAWVEPWVEYEDFQSVDEMRSSLNISYNYTPLLLHPESCRYRTEAECKASDLALQDHAERHRKRQQQYQRRRQQQLRERRMLNPSTGDFKVLVVLVYFADHNERSRPVRQRYQALWSNRITRWFDKNSHGNYEIDPVVTAWMAAEESEQYYANGQMGLNNGIQRAFWSALDTLDNQASWNWNEFDVDADGLLDSVVFLHSGYPAEAGSIECGPNKDARDRIWSHATATSSLADTWTSKNGAYKLNGFVVASAYDEPCTTNVAKMGVMVHEYMQTFGLPALFDGAPLVNRIGSGVGAFDIMGYPYGPGNDASLPGHLSTWSKMQVGWIEPEVIEYDGIYKMRPAENHADAYIIKTQYMENEYLILENRQPLQFDAQLWNGGIVIYHIDEKADGQKRRGYPGQRGWPDNGNHYQVSVLQADGEYHLEKGVNRGDAADFWMDGMELRPGGNGEYPNTDSYQADIRETGITISILPPTGRVVSFQISGLLPPPTEQPTAPPTMPPTLKPTPTPTLTEKPITLPPTMPPTIPPVSTPAPTEWPFGGWVNLDELLGLPGYTTEAPTNLDEKEFVATSAPFEREIHHTPDGKIIVQYIFQTTSSDPFEREIENEPDGGTVITYVFEQTSAPNLQFGSGREGSPRIQSKSMALEERKVEHAAEEIIITYTFAETSAPDPHSGSGEALNKPILSLDEEIVAPTLGQDAMFEADINSSTPNELPNYFVTGVCLLLLFYFEWV